MRIHRDERGQTIILVALSLPLLLGFVGFATDVGSLFKDKRTLQTAADAAAIAAALSRNSDFNTAGKNASKANGYEDGTNGVHVVINNGPTWQHSNYKGVSGYYEATVTKPEPTIFLALFGHPTVTVTARAVAGIGAGSGCLYTVAPTGTTFVDKGGGNSSLTAPNCGLVVESNSDPAMALNGNTKLDFGSIGVVGTFSKKGGSGSVSPTPVTGIAPESDPLNYLPQFTFTTGKTNTVSCYTGYICTNSPISVPTSCATTSSGVYKVAAGATLSQGCYVGLTFPSSGTVTLNPGLYLVSGDVTFGSGNVTGSGVTFYTNGNLNFGSGTYTLSAPNDDTLLFNGVLFAESIDDNSDITFQGKASSVIKGIVYAPDTSLTMKGNPSLTLDADFVVHDITLKGDVTLTSYAALSGVASPLSTVVLVE